MLKISLAEGGSGGFVAMIEAPGENSLWLNKARDYKTARGACANAALMLRVAADRFDRLAIETEPTRETVHIQINGDCALLDTKKRAMEAVVK